MTPTRVLLGALLCIAGVGGAGCGSTDAMNRVSKATQPDEPLPAVPKAPRSLSARPPLPRVVMMIIPGLDSRRIEDGISKGILPTFERMRAEGLVCDVVMPGHDVDATNVLARFFLGAADAAGASDLSVPYVIREQPSSDGSDDASEGVTEELTDGAGPAVFPVAESALASAPLLDAACAGERSAFVLRCPLLLPLRGDQLPGGLHVLGAGALPPLTYGDDSYLFVREGDDDIQTTVRGTALTMRPATGDKDGDVFLVPIRLTLNQLPLGHLTMETTELFTTLEVRATKDRTRATLVSSEMSIDNLVTGQWSRPLRLGFQWGPRLRLVGRTRVYLVPTGTPVLHMLIETPTFDPIQPPAWQPLSFPAGLAAELDRSLLGPLPRFSEPLPFGAFEDGWLDVRDMASAIELAHHTESRLFQGVLVERDDELLIQWLPLLEQVEQVVRLGPGDAVTSGEVIEFFGVRTHREHLADAALHRIDALVAAVLSVAASAEVEPEMTVMVWSPSGVLAMNRQVDEVPTDVGIDDVSATVLSLLGVEKPASFTGEALRGGPLMPGLPIEELTIPAD